MKWSKYIALALSVLLVLNNVTLVSQAASYSDVPSWATDEVKRVSDEGLMVGNSSGKFEPYEQVSYFSLVEVLAKMAGYKNPNIDPNTTTEEKNFIKNAYTVNKWVIDNYSKGKSKWQHSQDEKIAYLLQKGIVDQADLSLFVKGSGSSEQYGYVTKEALSKYLVRLLGMEKQALSLSGSTSFKDNSSINDMYKPYVALLKNISIVSGGSDNKFNPRQDVTKVILAVFINNVLEYLDENDTSSPGDVSGELQEVTGTVTEVYDFPGMQAVKIMITNTNSILYKVAENADYYKNNAKVSGSLSQLVSKNDTVKVYINSKNYIQKLYLGTSTGTTPTVPTTPNHNNNNTNTPVSYDEVTGVIQSIDATVITLKVKYITFSETKEVEKKYALASGAPITLNGDAAGLDDLEKGSVATVNVSNGVIYSLEALSKSNTIEGVVIEKVMQEDSYLITIRDEYDEEYRYRLTNDTEITKQGKKRATYNDIAVGNQVVVEAEYDKAIEVTCSTDYNSYEGFIEMIEISRQPKLSIKSEDGLIHNLTFDLDANLYDDDNSIEIYDLRLGYEVEVDVDGNEIYGLELKNKISQNTLEGVIMDVEDNGRKLDVKVKSDITGNYYMKEIKVNSTKILKNGSSFSRTQLEEDMRVIITLKKNSNDEADVIYVFE